MIRLGNAGGCDATSTNCSELDSTWAPEWSSVIALWHLDESSGAGTAADSGPVGTYTGSTQAGVTLGATGKIKTAASFDGSSTGYIAAGNLGATPLQGTIAFWMNPAVV